MPSYILIVDDDELLRRSMAFTLEHAGYRVQTAGSAETALQLVQSSSPDLILLDVGLPGMDGLQAVRLLREHCPVIFITARRRGLDEVLGLELGAEDYITKPFDPDVLLARIRAVLRRSQTTLPSPSRPTTMTVGDIVIDPSGHTVTVEGQLINLTPLEFRLLYTLAQQAGQVISSDELLTRVWGTEYSGEPQAVYVYIRSLREKLEGNPQNPRRIVTIRSVGYKLIPHQED